jgi:hypothetical protein
MPHASAAAIFSTFVEAAAHNLREQLPAEVPAQHATRVFTAAAEELRQRQAGAEFYVGTGFGDALDRRNAAMRAAWSDRGARLSPPQSSARLKELADEFHLTSRQVRAVITRPAATARPAAARRPDLATCLMQVAALHALAAWPGIDVHQLRAALLVGVNAVRCAHGGRAVYMTTGRAQRYQARDGAIRGAVAAAGPDGATAGSAARAHQVAAEYGLSVRRVRAIVAQGRKGGPL